MTQYSQAAKGWQTTTSSQSPSVWSSFTRDVCILGGTLGPSESSHEVKTCYQDNLNKPRVIIRIEILRGSLLREPASVQLD